MSIQQLQPNYKFYPSLLDQFEKFLHVDRDFEGFFNLDENGEYKKTYEEIEASAKQNLIDSINRVPFDSEAADKGTVFNELVDAILHEKRSSKIEMRGDFKNDAITGIYNNRTFVFSYKLVCDAAEYFRGALSQVLVSANIQTKYGIVNLYGYVDEIKKDIIYDIKTTSRYEFGKYSEGWQKHVYPYCLVESGEMDAIKGFEYTAYALKGGTGRTPLITATQYPEYYPYDHERTTSMLMQHCERFIEFLEENKDLITDKKIFGGENDFERVQPIKMELTENEINQLFEIQKNKDLSMLRGLTKGLI